MASNWRVEITVEVFRSGMEMDRFWSKSLTSGVLAGLILGCLAYAQAIPSQPVVSPASTPSQPAVSPSSSSNQPEAPSATTPSSITPIVTEPENAEEVDPASLLPDLPSLPHAKATLIGGTIQKVDRIRDQVTVQVFGGGKMRVFFDPRTHIYAGSVAGSTTDLRVGDRIYVDTILDGDLVFARNIRLANRANGGGTQGVVISYRPSKNELVLRDLLSPEPVKLRFTSGTRIVQDGHAAYANQLIPGTLVNVNFDVQNNDRNAREVSILAVPGTDFTFGGVVTSLDLHIGLLVLTASTDRKTYEIYLDPSRIPVDDRLHLGADVTTVANFDGTRYVARTLTVNSK
jgi:Domain of unknown function (DUF5666)